jgi:hypothetical protein
VAFFISDAEKSQKAKIKAEKAMFRRGKPFHSIFRLA